MVLFRDSARWFGVFFGRWGRALCLSVALVGLLAGGCSFFRPIVSQKAVSASLIGLTERELLACAGRPTQVEGSVPGRRVLHYLDNGERNHFGAEQFTLQPAGTGLGSGAEHITRQTRYCRARISVQDFRVLRADLRESGGALVDRSFACERLFRACSRK